MDKHKKRGSCKWLMAAGILVAGLLFAVPATEPVYAYMGFSAVSDIAVNNVSVARYGHYKLAFDANKGTGATAVSGTMPVKTEYVLDAPLTITNAYSRTGYDFTGWNTKAYGTDVPVSVNGDEDVTASMNVTGETLKAVDGSEVTLYAQWKAHTYSVKFHKSRTESEDETVTQTHISGDEDIAYDKAFVLQNNTFSRKGYELAGWAVSDGGDTVTYQNMDVVRNLTTIDKDTINLYAVWHGPEVKVEDVDAEDVDHQHTFVWRSDYEGHWQLCTGCGYTTEKESHDAYDTKTVIGDLTSCKSDNYIFNDCSKCGHTWKSHEGQKKHNPFVTKDAAHNTSISGRVNGDQNYFANNQRRDLYCADCGEEIDVEAWGAAREEYLHDERYDVEGLRDRIEKTGDMPRYHVQDGEIIGGPYGVGTCDICGYTTTATNYGEFWFESADKDFDSSNSKLGYDAWNKVQIIDPDSINVTYTANSDGTYTAVWTYNLVPDFTSASSGSPWWNYTDGNYFSRKSSSFNYDAASKKVTYTIKYTNTDSSVLNGILAVAHRFTYADGTSVTMQMRYRVSIDFTAPVITQAEATSSDESNGWHKTLDLNISGTEDMGQYVYIDVFAGDDVLVTSHMEQVRTSDRFWSYSYSPEIAADASRKDIKVRIRDTSYNETIQTFHVTNIDSAVPVMTNTIDYSGQWAKERTVTVHIDDGDSSGNVTDGNIEIALNKHSDYQDGTNTGTDFTRTWTFTGDKYDEEPYVVLFRDKAGNEGSAAIYIGGLDNSSPTVTGVSLSGLEATVTASDYVDGYGDGSGVVSYGYIDMSAETAEVVKQSSNTFTLPHTGEFLIVAYDKVGNMSEPYHINPTTTASGAKKHIMRQSITSDSDSTATEFRW